MSPTPDPRKADVGFPVVHFVRVHVRDWFLGWSQPNPRWRPMEVDKKRSNISCQENLYTTLDAITMAMDKKVMKQTVDFDECLKDSPRFR